MSAENRLERRARALTRLARWYDLQANRARGASAWALRATAQDLQAEALRLSITATDS